MIHSIKIRITLFYTAIVFILTAMFATFLYFGLEKLLYEQFDRELHLYTDVIEDSFNPYENTFEFLKEGTENLKDIKLNWVRIIREDGSFFFISDRFAENKIPFPIDRARKMQPREKIIRQFQTTSGNFYRGIILPVRNYKLKKNYGWVEVSRSLKHVRNSLVYLRKLLIVSMPTILVLIGFISFYMVHRSFLPLSQMSKKIDGITDKNLEQRLPVMNANDEIGKLALQFNSLLDRLDHSFNKQKRLLVDVAHELKTPLAVLRSHWEHEVENGELTESIRCKLSADIEEIARLSKMVSDLLILSQSKEVGSKLNISQMDISEFLQKLLPDIQLIAEVKKQKIKFNPSKAMMIKGDDRFLRRLFINLLDNAVKYTPPNGKISVECQTHNTMVQITITDNGIGITHKDLPHVFERLYRSDEARSRDPGGSGLGLTICQWIAEMHGGRIHINSVEEEGTTVNVYLPLTNC